MTTPKTDDNAAFEVVYVDPECSGMELRNHLGGVVTHAKRCGCRDCCIINGEIFGMAIPFSVDELSPLNDAAKRIYDEVRAYQAASRAKYQTSEATQKPEDTPPDHRIIE